jgi:hypothetical protein
MSWCKTVTDYRRISLNEAMVFLNTSTSLHTMVADGKFLKVTENGEVSEMTRDNSNTSNIQKEGLRFKTE